MAIITPLAVPLVLETAGGSLDVLEATVAAILGGAVFGDHCSPISDTTILSSMASGCDHVDHVRTQLPYSMFAAAVAIAIGYAGHAITDVAPGLLLLFGAGVIAVTLRMTGRLAEEPRPDA